MDHGYALAAGAFQTLSRKRKRSEEKREKEAEKQSKHRRGLFQVESAEGGKWHEE